jgi:hypothetical protein
VNVHTLECSVRSDYRNRCRELIVFENWKVRQMNVRISEHKYYSYIHELSGMSLQLVTVVTKLLVNLA